MSKPLQYQIVFRARQLISDPARWTQGDLAKRRNGLSIEPSDPDAYRFCAVGALTRAASELTGDVFAANTLATEVHVGLLSFAEIPAGQTLECINDFGRGHVTILKIFDDYLAAN
jgi:hypothetical protein